MSKLKVRQDHGPISEEMHGPCAKPQAAGGAKPRAAKAGGPGHAFARRVAALRMALIEAVTEEDMRAIAHQLVALARVGDLAAIKLVLQYVLGKPGSAVALDKPDQQELLHCGLAPEPAAPSTNGEVTDNSRQTMTAPTVNGGAKPQADGGAKPQADIKPQADTKPQADGAARLARLVDRLAREVEASALPKRPGGFALAGGWETEFGYKIK
jgi:hypothetical protein